MITPEYKSEKLIFDVPMNKAIELAMDRAMCAQACAACPCYGQLWSCPPFVNDTSAQHPERFDILRLIVTRIRFDRRPLPGADSQAFHEVKRALIPKLAKTSRELNGVLYGFAGQCDFCTSECTRLSGEACRHPDLAGPSLEGVGFNVTALLEHFCNLTLEWGTDTLTYVAGIAFNRK